MYKLLQYSQQSLLRYVLVTVVVIHLYHQSINQSILLNKRTNQPLTLICMKHMYIKYKTHNTVYTQHNQLHKNTLQYGSSTSGARDSLNLLSGVKSMLLGSEFNFCLY